MESDERMQVVQQLCKVHGVGAVIANEWYTRGIRTIEEALEAGLVNWVAPHEALMDEAQRIAEGWVDDGKEREYRGGLTREELSQINREESVQLANAFLSPRFLNGQFRFLWKKKKRPMSLAFLAARVTHPLWSRLL